MKLRTVLDSRAMDEILKQQERACWKQMAATVAQSLEPFVPGMRVGDTITVIKPAYRKGSRVK